MSKKSLTSKFLVDKVVAVVITVVFLYIWIFYLPYIRFFLIGFCISAVVGFIGFMPRTNIEYDENNIYIGGSESAIELKNVTAVRITNFAFNHRSRWKITYMVNSLEEYINFYPDYANLDAFTKLVQLKNPSAQISYSTGPF